jgi:hypothetical protein
MTSAGRPAHPATGCAHQLPAPGATAWPLRAHRSDPSASSARTDPTPRPAPRPPIRPLGQLAAPRPQPAALAEVAHAQLASLPHPARPHGPRPAHPPRGSHTHLLRPVNAGVVARIGGLQHAYRFNHGQLGQIFNAHRDNHGRTRQNLVAVLRNFGPMRGSGGIASGRKWPAAYPPPPEPPGAPSAGRRGARREPPGTPRSAPGRR